MAAGGGSDKENFDLDLMPMISMMSVCICFLLLTAVWTQIGSMNIEQGLGQESSRQDTKAASLWVTMQANGQVKFQVMDSPETPASLRERNLLIGAAGSGWASVEDYAKQVKGMLPALNTALIMPDSRVNYGEVITMMDRLKRLEIKEIGIAPL